MSKEEKQKKAIIEGYNPLLRGNQPKKKDPKQKGGNLDSSNPPGDNKK